MADNFEWASDLLAVFDFNDPELRQAMAAAGKDPNAKCSSQHQQERLAEELQEKLHLKSNAAETVSPKALDEGIKHDTVERESSVESATSASSATLSPAALAENKRIAIYKVLAQCLRGDWRSFGRALKTREGTMDDIEFEFPSDLSSRIYKLLQLFEEDECHDPKQNVLLICRALDECRRKDLRRKVETIMSH